MAPVSAATTDNACSFDDCQLCVPITSNSFYTYIQTVKHSTVMECMMPMTQKVKAHSTKHKAARQTLSVMPPPNQTSDALKEDGENSEREEEVELREGERRSSQVRGEERNEVDIDVIRLC